jgi:hypothetical protein
MLVGQDRLDQLFSNIRRSEKIAQDKILNGRFYPFEVLKEIVRKAKIKSYPEYLAYHGSLSEKEKKHWPVNLWLVYKGQMNSRAFFYRDEGELLRKLAKVKKVIKDFNLNTRKKYRDFRKNLLPEEKEEYPANPHETFRGFYMSSFFSVHSRSVKKYSYAIQKKRANEAGVKNRKEFGVFLSQLSKEERAHWHFSPWRNYNKTEEDFFRLARTPKRYSPKELRDIFLREKVLYEDDLAELKRNDSKIISKPQFCSWFAGWDDLFPYRQSLEIERSGRYFFYVKQELLRRLRMNLIFSDKDYRVWLSSLPLKEARLFRLDIFDTKGGWSWRSPELFQFLSAAELSSAVKKLGLKKREEYFATRVEYPMLPEKPEEFPDWPANIENAGYTDSDAWEIIFGTFDENSMNSNVEDPFFAKVKVRREIRDAEKSKNDFPLGGIFSDDVDEEIGSEAAIEALLGCV